jgi:hypothetical protein
MFLLTIKKDFLIFFWTEEHKKRTVVHRQSTGEGVGPCTLEFQSHILCTFRRSSEVLFVRLGLSSPPPPPLDISFSV